MDYERFNFLEKGLRNHNIFEEFEIRSNNAWIAFQVWCALLRYFETRD